LPNLINQFINHLISQGRSQHTAVAYKKDLEQFAGFLTTKDITDVREIKKDDIEGFIKKTLSDNYTKKSASRKLNSIRSFFRFLKNQEIINQNPSLDVPHPRYTQQPPRILNKLEYRALRDCAKENPRNYAIVETLLQTGMKISELANLKINDISEETIMVGIGSKNKREVPLTKSLKKAINDYLKTKPETKKEDYLFTTRTNKSMIIRNIRQIITHYFQKVGINDATVNDLRNTFIAHQLNAGVSVDYVAKIVGHKRLSSTERYLSLVNAQEEKKEKLEEL
jgi:site-specific recombinase XerD